MKVILLAFLLCSCGYFKRDQKPSETTSPTPEELVVQAELYCELSQPAYLDKGHVHSKCDGSGFTALYGVACDGVDLSVFSDEDGKLWRSVNRDCYPEKSKAESSRDMWLMRMVNAWERQDLAWIEKAIQFGEKNQWVVCEAVDLPTKVGRCILSPQLYNLLYDMRSRLKGQALMLVQDSDDALPDFTAHLDVLRIYLSGEVRGAITKNEKSRLKAYALREPMNGLYQAVWNRYDSGDQTSTYHALGKFPIDRLPNDRDDWCEEYLFQRDMMRGDQVNSDWLPCPGPALREHSGTDFNLALYIARKR